MVVIWGNNYPDQAQHGDCRLRDLVANEWSELSSFDDLGPRTETVRFICQPRFIPWQSLEVPNGIPLDPEGPPPDLESYRHVRNVGVTTFKITVPSGVSFTVIS